MEEKGTVGGAVGDGAREGDHRAVQAWEYKSEMLYILGSNKGEQEYDQGGISWLQGLKNYSQ